MDEKETLLRQAITEKRPVRCTYHGHERLLCPHALGYKHGNLHLMAYQFGGSSSSGPILTPTSPSDGPPSYWRCMDVGQIYDLAILDETTWYTCREHGSPQTCIDDLLVQISY